MIMVSLAAVPVSAMTPATKAARYPFAGYTTQPTTPPTTITSAAATVTVPSFSCTKKIAAITAVATVFDPTGSEFSSAGVYIGCSSKTQTLAALADIDNVFTVLTVTITAGDTVALSTTCGPSGISVSIDDETTSSTGTESSATAETCTQAEVGDDGVSNGKARGKTVPLPAFGAIDFTAAMVNGVALGSVPSSAANYNEGKKAVITTGALTAGGTAFVTTQGP